jgi:hypothetical protein
MSGDRTTEQLEIDYEEASLASDEPFGVGATPKVKPKKPTPKCSAGYMVSVDGNIGPKKVHPTIEDAKAEAMRLSPSNAGKIIRILYLVGYYEPTHEFKELV